MNDRRAARFHGAQLLAGIPIPDAHGAIVAAAGEQLRIRRRTTNVRVVPKRVLRALSSCPEAGSQIRIVLSAPPEASSEPVFAKASARTLARWPLRVLTSRPVAGSHRRIARSLPAEAKSWSFGENVKTQISPLWPLSTRSSPALMRGVAKRSRKRTKLKRISASIGIDPALAGTVSMETGVIIRHCSVPISSLFTIMFGAKGCCKCVMCW